jgi:hypothetical protein
MKYDPVATPPGFLLAMPILSTLPLSCDNVGCCEVTLVFRLRFGAQCFDSVTEFSGASSCDERGQF